MAGRSGSRAATTPTRRRMTSSTSSPTARPGSTSIATASAPTSTATTARPIFPGAPEVFDNGVDENCDGRDNPNLDRDADGFAQPADCDDGNAAIRPNALEIRGNPFDENCDRRADPFAQLAAVVSNQWAVARTFARLRTLVVHNAPKGARIVLTCKGRGCPFKKARRRTVARELQRIVLHRGFRRARLRVGRSCGSRSPRRAPSGARTPTSSSAARRRRARPRAARRARRGASRAEAACRSVRSWAPP